MTKVRSILKRCILLFVVLMQVAFYPAAISFADTQGDADPAASTQTTDSTPSSTTDTSTTDPASTDPTPPSSPTTGPTAPTGADSQTYTYNPDTGLWENAYYTWNPVTHQTAPKTAPNYSYNPATGMWDTTEWRYDAPSGRYVPNTVSTTKPPAGVSANGGPNDPLIANTGPNSNNNIGINSNNNGTFNLFYNTTISNTLNSSAISGNAGVLQNTNGGSASSGDASDIANLLNLLQSSWDPSMSFTANVNGNYTGDLLLDPNQILNSGPSSQNGIQTNKNANLDINVQANGQIINNVNLLAKSGDATVNSNTNGGDAKSGNANALANIINLINSGISAGQSFLGVININGNLNGDILLPENLVATVDTTGPNSLNTVNQTDNKTINALIANNNSITNNTDLSANSGQANVSGNTTAGGAHTGNASTKLNIYNLTGRDIISDNALLVFVNLKGQWTGLIFNAPAGSNTVLGTGPNSSNTINANSNANLNINENNNSAITNNITAHAESGLANVSDNTNAGGAFSGDATATANILNLINTKLSVNGWFGVLFINVLGAWDGSFGVNTAAGNPAAATATSAAGGSGFVKFVPKADNYIDTAASGLSQNTNQGQQVIASTSDSNDKQPPANQPAPHAIHHVNWVIPSIGVSLGLLLLGWEEIIALLKSRSIIT